MTDLERALIGRTVIEVAVVQGGEGDDEHPVLTLDDGTRITFRGDGYDGLWTSVGVEISPP